MNRSIRMNRRHTRMRFVFRKETPQVPQRQQFLSQTKVDTELRSERCHRALLVVVLVLDLVAGVLAVAAVMSPVIIPVTVVTMMIALLVAADSSRTCTSASRRCDD